MSLSAREQHVLDSITDELTVSDPRLAGFMATFTRLVSGEEMPLREKIWSGSRRTGRPRRNRQRRGPGTMWLRPRSGSQRPGLSPGPLLLLVWLLISVMLIAVAVILSHGGSGRAGGCAEPWPASCADPLTSHPPHPAKTATSRRPAPVQQVIPAG